MTLLAFLFALADAEWSYVPDAITWSFCVALLACLAQLSRGAIVAYARRRGLLIPTVVVVGATAAAEELIARAKAGGGFRVIGVFDDRRGRVGPELLGIPVLGTASDLLGHPLLPFIDRIIITVPAQAAGRIAELVTRLAPIPHPIELMLEASPDRRGKAVQTLADFVTSTMSGAAPAGDQLLKRSFDLVVASLALLLLAPILLAVALAIKADSPGPIFFRQLRHGFLNEEFRVWKFRSMHVDRQDDHAHVQVRKDDSRVTRVGAFLRHTSLDELPQLWNVVRGEMSLVGPRPHAIGMIAGGEDAKSLVESYAHRHRMKPGLTGWAAVNGSRGPADSAEAIRRRVELDLEYIHNQSFWFDLQIIARTLPCLLGDRSTTR
jgi:exopolysaccharide biosynthesis polyprenyl glycosylphosphotransferase